MVDVSQRTLGGYLASRPTISLTKQGATRNLPITPSLATRIQSAINYTYGPGYTA